MEFHGGIQILTLVKLTLWELEEFAMENWYVAFNLTGAERREFEGMIHNNYQ